MKTKYKYHPWMDKDPNSTPDPGQFNQPTSPVNDGGDQKGDATPAPALTTTDYKGWNWEQTLNTVLSLKLPTRAQVTNVRWTAINFNSSGGSGLYRIFAATWDRMPATDAHDTFVYLNPVLQTPGGVWDEFFYTPLTTLYQTVTSPPNYTNVSIDPRTFGSAAEAMAQIEGFYKDTSTTFGDMANDLKGDASDFKGQAGGAFAQLMDNLHNAAQGVSTQIGADPNSPASYSSLITQAGRMVNNFLLGIWNAMAGWTHAMEHTPIGAIYQAMINGGAIVDDGGGNYTIPDSLNTSFGDLTQAQAWYNIETAAKALWTKSVASTLDPAAQNWLAGLADNYMTAASGIQPITPPTMKAITPGSGDNSNTGPNTNFNMPNINMPNFNMGGPPGGGDPNLNLGGPGGGGPNGLPNTSLGGPNGLPNSLLGGGPNGLPNTALGGGPNGLPNTLLGGGPNGSPLDSLLGNPNAPGGLNSLLGNPNAPGGLNSLLGNPNAPGGLNSLLGNPNAPGGLNSLLGNPNGANELSTLQNALGNSGNTEAALKQALALAPPTGPLHNALETALADNGKVQSELKQALNGTVPVDTALQNALADNGQTQAALKQALAQAPSTGPLHNSLKTALGDANKTQTALKQALANDGTPASTALHHALTDDGKLQSQLNKALSSGQVPSHGPLHNALEHALGDSNKVKTALNHALHGGNVGSIHQAINDNKALQHELNKALSSGQVPSHGPLHNELEKALADSKKMGNELHQALTSAGSPAEPNPLHLNLGKPGDNLAGLKNLLGPHNGINIKLGGPAAPVPGAPGPGVQAQAGPPGPVTALPGSGAPPVSSGRFDPSGGGAGGAGPVGEAGAPGGGTGAVPFFPPMAGGMGGMGMGQGAQGGQQERERTTWLSEDEDVWGTEPRVGPPVLGRYTEELDDELDSYDEFPEDGEQRPRTAPSRLNAR